MLPQKDNRHQLVPWIKYYLFIKKEHPLGAKLGVPQKICYVLIPWLIFLQGFTGLCLWDTTASIPLFAAATTAVGGAMSMRIIHYFGMFVFIIFTFIHLYLVFIEGTANAKLMLFRKEHGGLVYDPNRMVMVGEDDLGGQH
jgi:Ni/Fe-hydrogenase 1 B-type cytochrome subunit